MFFLISGAQIHREIAFTHLFQLTEAKLRWRFAVFIRVPGLSRLQYLCLLTHKRINYPCRHSSFFIILRRLCCCCYRTSKIAHWSKANLFILSHFVTCVYWVLQCVSSQDLQRLKLVDFQTFNTHYTFIFNRLSRLYYVYVQIKMFQRVKVCFIID